MPGLRPLGAGLTVGFSPDHYRVHTLRDKRYHLIPENLVKSVVPMTPVVISNF